jgi:hypothetical protein
MISRAGDIQVEALEFVLLKHLSWNIALGETDEFLLKTFLVRLWAYWAEHHFSTLKKAHITNERRTRDESHQLRRGMK